MAERPDELDTDATCVTQSDRDLIGKATEGGTAKAGRIVVAAALMLAFAASRVAIMSIPSEREYDEGVYLLSARALLAGHELFSAVFSSQPPAFLETIAAAMRLLGDSIETARLTILGFALVAMTAIGFIGRRLAGPWAGVAAIAALGVSATFIDLAHVVEAELPAMAVALVAICAALQARRRGWHRLWLVGSGALLALAALFKLIVVPLAAPLGLLLFLAPAADDETEWALDGRGLALFTRVAGRSLLVAAGAVAVGLLPLLLYDVGSLYQQTIGFHLTKHEYYRLTPIGNLLRAARHVRAEDAMGATALIGIVLMLLRNRLAALWLVTWLAMMFAAIVPQAPLFWRHFVLLSPPIALAAGAAAPLLARRLRWTGPALLTIAVISLWIATTLHGAGRRGDAYFPLIPGKAKKAYSLARLHEVSDWIRDHTDASELVVSDDPIAVYLAGRQVPPGLCDTSTARIKSGSLTLEMATRESQQARVIVLRGSGRLSRMNGYVGWVARHYQRQPASKTGIESRRNVWIRNRSATGEKPGLRPAGTDAPQGS